MGHYADNHMIPFLNLNFNIQPAYTRLDILKRHLNYTDLLVLIYN